MTTVLHPPPTPIAGRTARPRAPRVLALPGWLLGAGLLGTGAGLAARHLAKAGWGVTPALGLALVALGLGLTCVSARTAWRALRSWWRLLLAPLGVVGLLLASCTGLAAAYVVVPATDVDAARPAGYEDVAFRTADGATLSGWYLPSRNRAAVVLLHGAGSTRAGVLDEAALLARHGYGVLAYDARGHGRSDGPGTDLGWHGDADVAAAVSFVQGRSDVDPQRVGLLGLSMGAEQALGATDDGRVRAVVAEGATGRTAQDKDGWLPGGVPGVVQRLLDRVTFGVADLLSSASPPQALSDAVRAADAVPVLLVVGGEVENERLAADDLVAAAPARVDVWEVPDAGHTQGLATAPGEYERRVVGFLDRHLLGQVHG